VSFSFIFFTLDTFVLHFVNVNSLSSCLVPAGGRGLAMIIFLLSFVWPYSKQLIVFGLWFAPPSTVSVSKRGSILLWLDILGKWSIVDIFVLVLVLVGFRLSIQR
jgi:uncharacterized paraquat-inducible protein A